MSHRTMIMHVYGSGSRECDVCGHAWIGIAGVHAQVSTTESLRRYVDRKLGYASSDVTYVACDSAAAELVEIMET